MGVQIILLVIFYIFIYGIFRLLQERYYKENIILYIAVKNQEEVVEGLLRYIFYKLKKEALPFKVEVIIEHSEDRTYDIVIRLAGKMSFIVREINNFDELCRSFAEETERRICIWDIRKFKDINEIDELINTGFELRA